MDTTVSSPAPQTSPHSRFYTYVEVAMILAVITGIELLLIFLPFPRTLLITGLVLLSAVKFLFVIFIFMHLRWDRLVCTCVFFIGLLLGGGTLWALVNLFGSQASVPLTLHP